MLKKLANIQDDEPSPPQRPALPRPLPPMRDTPLAQQDELRQRHQVRHDVAEAMKQIAAALKVWVRDLVLDQQRFKTFNGRGHRGEYTVFPEETLAAKLIDLGWTEDQLLALTTMDTPLDLMTSEELAFVLERVNAMLKWFAQNPTGGNFDRACVMYEAIGSVVRRAVQQRTGHPPEQFPTPDVILTGDKHEAKRLKPVPYRAPLFPSEPPQEDPS
ncbi:MAG: hypothetical protein H0X24_01585 [Ktedonobacterales bacterium]|nr:hypothetical protein [Ktedonobacterales bacterium]